MKFSTSVLQKKLFGISNEEVTFIRRGFNTRNVKTTEHLETVGEEFLFGYHLAMRTKNIDSLINNLNQIKASNRGFAFEGAAMNLALLDYLIPWRKKRLERFIEGGGDKHIYMVYVGIGWAIARIPWLRNNILKSISNYDPLLKWLIIDGYGFHEGYFRAEKFFCGSVDFEFLPEGYCRKAFAQGLGRCLWFYAGGNIYGISEIIARFPREFQPDLWSGIGLACAYAGGVKKEDLTQLTNLASGFLPNLFQGVVFASACRIRAKNLVKHTEDASQIICNLSANKSASIAFSTMENLPKNSDNEFPNYAVWRQKITDKCSKAKLYYEKTNGEIG